jgi:hypothetical protein
MVVESFPAKTAVNNIDYREHGGEVYVFSAG